MTAAEESALARRVRAGDAAARERMIEANIALVLRWAGRYRCEGLEYADLVQEGILGLIAAVDRFDPERGRRFSTYGAWWIRQSIVRAIQRQGDLIGLPLEVAQVLPRVNDGREVLRDRLGRLPTVAEIAAETGLPPSQVALALRCPEPPVSLELLVGMGDETPLADVVPDPQAPDPEECLIRACERAALEALLGCLRPCERLVIEQRFGLADGYEHTLQEVGDQLGVSRERVRQIEERALGKLREAAGEGPRERGREGVSERESEGVR